MKKAWTLVLLGLLAFLILLVATLPARVLLERIPAVTAAGVSGSIWSGRAETLSVQGIGLGSARWRLFALPLLRGRLEIDAKIAPPGGTGEAHCSIAMNRSVHCSRVVAALPIEAVQLSSLARGWSGRINADFATLDLERGWPVNAQGRLEVVDVERPAGAAFGSYRVEFPASAGNTGEKSLTGALQDIGGPLNVTGTIRLSPDRTYVIDGHVAARGDAPPEIARSIEYLGFPDAQGRREFSLAGSL